MCISLQKNEQHLDLVETNSVSLRCLTGKNNCTYRYGEFSVTAGKRQRQRQRERAMRKRKSVKRAETLCDYCTIIIIHARSTLARRETIFSAATSRSTNNDIYIASRSAVNRRASGVKLKNICPPITHYGWLIEMPRNLLGRRRNPARRDAAGDERAW